MVARLGTSLLIFSLLGAGSAFGGDPSCIDGLCFIDRGATGEIDLGLHKSGIAVMDYDNDGFMDLVIGNQADTPNQLFHNEPHPTLPGNRTFVDATAGSGLDDADGTDRDARGILVADYDNDGDSDIFMVGYLFSPESHGVLYRNDGAGQFTNVSETSGVRGTDYRARSAGWTDYDNDGFVDLLICADSGSPDNLILLHNNEDGTFSEASYLLPDVTGFSTAYSVLWMDYDADGYDDGFVLADGGPSVLLKNVDDGQGGREFINVAQDAGYTDLGELPMGIAAGDYDGDGDLDIAVSNRYEGSYYENTGGAFQKFFPFDSIFGWGVAWLDADNDRDLDLYMAGSWGNPEGSSQFDKLFRNLGGGVFDDVSPVLNGIMASSRFSVQLDFNNDGRQDVITLNPGSSNESVSVYDNISTTDGNWINIELRGDGLLVNSDAVGAVIRVTADGVSQVRPVLSGSSTTASEDLRQHFGLGDAAIVDEIEVVWPRVGDLENRTETYPGPFAANQFMLLLPTGTSSVGETQQGGAKPDLRIQPMSRGLSIRYTLANTDLTSLSVFDIHGRRIHEVWRGMEPAGMRSHVWAQTNALGQRVGSGVYFITLRSDFGSATRKAFVIR
jgi:hypothetical protein